MEKKEFTYLDKQSLAKVGENADWRQVFQALGLEKSETKSKEDDWWALSPFAEENTPSFHLNDRGFYCFSTGKNGGLVELVKEIKGIDPYAAGRWLLEVGASSLDGQRSELAQATKAVLKKKEKEPNKPIRQNLVPLLDLTASHEQFQRRGIGPGICNYLGCGFLPQEKSPKNSSLSNRIVFQVRGVQKNKGEYKACILSHMGRATTVKQLEESKWWFYKGFVKTQEFYNIDKLLLDPQAKKQTQEQGRIVLVEGCFDVAKLVEAGILNSMAMMGAYLNQDQIPRLELIKKELGVYKVLLFQDRDPAGEMARVKAVELLQDYGFQAEVFDWEQQFSSNSRGEFGISEEITDPCEMSIEQIQWLRGKGLL